MAVAGPDQTVAEGATVQLAGEGTDPEGAALRFMWTQVSGPTVVLNSITDPKATFEAPEVPIRNVAPVLLSLSVTDAIGTSSNDEISINITSTDYGVFIVDEPGFGIDELYRYDSETDALSKISGPLVAGGGVFDYSISPDGQWVAYLADQEIDNTRELFVAAADGSDINKISGTLPAGRDVSNDFVWSPDSSKIAFSANVDQVSRDIVFVVEPSGNNLREIKPVDDQTPATAELDHFRWSADGRYLAQTELSLLDFETHGINVYDTQAINPNNVRITPALPAGANITAASYRWAPDGSRIVYAADQDTVGITGLYTVNPDGSSNTKVNATLVAGGGVGGQRWSPDSSRIAYLLRASISDDIEIHTVRPDGGDDTRVSVAPVVANFSGIPFWSPDSSRIAYLTEPDSAGNYEIYTVRSNGNEHFSISGTLAPRSVTFSTPTSFPIWSPDSSRIVYIATQDSADPFELFTARPDGSDRIKVSPLLVTGGDVVSIPNWSPDGTKVTYQADQDTDGVFEVYSVRPDGTDNIKVNGPLVAGGSAGGAIWSPDGSRIVYSADQDTDGVIELYMSTPDGLSNMKISGSLVVDGVATEFAWSP